MNEPIRFIDQDVDVSPAATTVEHVGGPMDGQLGEMKAAPDVVPFAEGRYLRSVRCAEDGVLRCVWQTGS